VARILALGVVGVAIGLTIAQWRDIERWPPPNAVTWTTASIGPADEHRDYQQELADTWAERDHLRSIHEAGLTADATDGLWIGLAASS
jgi:hypothetical protein